MTSSKWIVVVIGCLGIFAGLVYLLWPAQDSQQHAGAATDGDTTPASAPPQSSEGAEGVEARQQDDARAANADAAQELDAEPLLPPEAPPDLPAERPPPFSADFEEQLLASAHFSADPQRACLEWSRILPLSLRESARETERSLGLHNVMMACSGEGALGEHERRLAKEALHRYAELESTTEQATLRAAERFDIELDEERAYLLFATVHLEGTKVSLNGAAACTQPCTVAIPMDGEAHLLGFEHQGSRAQLSWRPPSLDAAPPALPSLR